MALRLREVRPSEDARWDAFVAAHPDGVVFHRSAWLLALAAEYGEHATCLAVEDDRGALRGVLPLMETRGLPLGLGGASGGRRMASLPRTPVAGPIADDGEALALLVRGAVELTPARAQLQLKLDRPSLDAVDAGITRHAWRVNYRVQLPGTPAEIRFGTSKQHASLRATCRRASEAGVTVAEALSLAEVRRWYALYLETMRHHVVPARSWRLFKAMWTHLRPHGMVRLFLAEHRGRTVAGNLIVTDGTTAFYLFNGADRDALGLHPNNLLQWEAIHRLCAEGHRAYDLGEVVEGQEGLARFKKKWGATPERLHRYYAPSPVHPPDPGDGHHTGPLSRLLHTAWPHMPLRATAAAGRLVYRYL